MRIGEWSSDVCSSDLMVRVDRAEDVLLPRQGVGDLEIHGLGSGGRVAVSDGCAQRCAVRQRQMSAVGYSAMPSVAIGRRANMDRNSRGETAPWLADRRGTDRESGV